MAMTMEELITIMDSVGQNGSSQLNLRSEDLQTKRVIKRLPMLKNALKKKSKLLLETEIALPFDPQTGKAEPDGFNPSNKYRPPFSATTVALALKRLADTSEALKSTLMKRAGVTNWDTGDYEHFTEDDWVIFAKYRVPRIFSLTVTSIKIPAMQGSDSNNLFARDYAVSVKRDPEGNVVGEMPVFLAANKFFRDRAYEKVKDYEDSIADANPPVTEDERKKAKSDIYRENPVQDDHPANFVRLFELPLGNDFKLKDDVLSGASEEIFKEYEVISRYKAAIRNSISKYVDKSWSVCDRNFDFWELDMTCPTTGDDTTMRGKAEIGQKTAFERPVPIDCNNYSKEAVENFTTAFRKYIDSDPKVENKVRASMRVSVLDEEAERRLVAALPTVIDMDNDKFITQEVVKNNAEFIKLIFGDEGDELVEEIEAGVSEREEGALDSDAAKADAKTYDLTADDFSDEPDDLGAGGEAELQSLDLSIEA